METTNRKVIWLIGILLLTLVVSVSYLIISRLDWRASSNKVFVSSHGKYSIPLNVYNDKPYAEMPNGFKDKEWKYVILSSSPDLEIFARAGKNSYSKILIRRSKNVLKLPKEMVDVLSTIDSVTGQKYSQPSKLGLDYFAIRSAMIESGYKLVANLETTIDGIPSISEVYKGKDCNTLIIVPKADFIYYINLIDSQSCSGPEEIFKHILANFKLLD